MRAAASRAPSGAAGRGGPPAPIPTRVGGRTWCAATSPRRRRTGCGSRISATCAAGRAWCSLASSWTPTPGAWSAGSRPTTCAPRWCSTRCGWRWPRGGPAPTFSSCTTAIAAARADSIGRRNARWRGVAMGEKRRAADRAGRPAMRSPGVRRWDGWSIVSGSGRRSLAGCRARTRRRRLACRPRSASGGFGRVAGCRRSRSPRRRGGICRSRSGRRSRSCVPAALGCGRLRVSSAARRRRFPGSSVATPRLAAAGSSIAPTTAQWHADLRARRPKPAKLAVNTELCRYVQDRLYGAVRRPDGVAGPEVRWIGRRHGRRADRRWARSWSPEQISNRLCLDFPDDESMRGAMRRSISLCMCRAGERCGVS